MQAQQVEVVNLPGKGLGVIASCTFAVGDLIISEAPLLTCSLTNTSTTALETELSGKLTRLDDGGRKQFYDLSDCHDGPPTPLGIFRTNAHPCGFQGAAKESGILPLICRINHSCSPNATHSWNKRKREQTIYAAKEIKVGEEITIPYRDNFGDALQRKAQLASLWRFDCTCRACKGFSAESNSRRVQIQKLDSLIYNSISSGEYDLGLRFVDKRLTLLKEEGEDTPKERFKSEWDAYQACDHKGDAVAKKKWLKLAMKDALLAFGADYAEEFRQGLINR